MPPKKTAKHHEDDKRRQEDDKHRDDKHEKGKDLRRAYEHFGRVAILQSALRKVPPEIAALVEQARAEAEGRDSRNAAELLRAAEHLSFAAALGESEADAQAGDSLITAVRKEFERLKIKAEEHLQEGDRAISQIGERSLENGEKAFAEGSYHRALELARAAEALTHVKPIKKRGKPAPSKLKPGKKPLSLLNSQ